MLFSSKDFCCLNKYTLLSCAFFLLYVYRNYENVEIVQVEQQASRFIYGVKTLELDQNYTTGLVIPVTEANLKKQITGSQYSFDDMFRGMENTLKSTNSVCVAMHHYKLKENALQLAGLLINNHTDFINLINPSIRAKSNKNQVQIMYRGHKTNRYQYVWVDFYHDMSYAQECDEEKIIHNGNTLRLDGTCKRKVDWIFSRFYSKVQHNKRFVKMTIKLHNEYAVCIQTIIEEFTK